MSVDEAVEAYLSGAMDVFDLNEVVADECRRLDEKRMVVVSDTLLVALQDEKPEVALSALMRTLMIRAQNKPDIIEAVIADLVNHVTTEED